MTEKLTYEELEKRLQEQEQIKSEVKQAKEAIKASEANIKALIEVREESIWSIDRNYRYQIFNNFFKKAYVSAYGIYLKQGINAIEILSPELKNFWKEKYDKALSGNEIKFEFSEAFEGKKHYFMVMLNPIYKDHKVNGVSAISFDITEQKLFQEKLRQSESRYRAVSKLTSDYAYAYKVEADGMLTLDWVTGALSRLTGYTRHELRSLGGWEYLIYGEDLSIPMDQLRILLSNKAKTVEYRIVTKDNKIRWMRDNAHPGWDATENRVTRIKGAVQDITEQKRAEEELRRSEERYREYFEEDISGAFISTPEGKLITCNQEYRKIFGFNSIQHALDTSVNTIFESYNDRVSFLNRLKTQKKVTGYEHKFKKIDGTPIQLVENASGVFDKEGNLTHIRGFLLDVTRQKKLETQLIQAQKMESIGTLAGGIAHDFNNILFPIVGHTQMLLEDIPQDSPNRDHLNRIYSSALRAKDLIKQILTFSRQEKRELKLIKVQPIIKETLKLIRSTLPTTIEIKQDIDIDCGVIKADPTQIFQIIMNLSSNACHAMEGTGGELKIDLKEVQLGLNDILMPDMPPGGYVCLTITDTGKGMNKQLTRKIFDPFFTTKKRGKGTGMGLSVVHGIVTGMGGAVHVYSEPGKGTKFNIYFPSENRFIEEQTSQDRASKQDKGTKMAGTEHILLVDDEEEITIMEKQMLERLGYQVTSRTSSLEALETFRENPGKFDLVITDMAMPNMSGDRLASELTRIRNDIPVLLCSGFIDDMSKEKAASLGIKGVLLKPIVLKDLAGKVRELLGETIK